MNLLNNPEKRKWMIVVTIFIAIICNYLDGHGGRQALPGP